MKKNIQPLNDSLNTIHKLKGVSYDWIDDNNDDHEIGLIAQDVEEVVPEVVRRLGNSDFKGIEYQKLTALLISSKNYLMKLIYWNQRHKYFILYTNIPHWIYTIIIIHYYSVKYI